MKKFILAAVAAAGLFAFAPASASAQTSATGMSRSVMDANAQVVVVRPGMRRDRMMHRGPMRMERRTMMRRDMRRMDRRMDRRSMHR